MDLSFIKGYYSSVKKLPVTPGFEGSGIVIASGGNEIIKDWCNFKTIFYKVDCMDGV